MRAVFISYASEDALAARRICEALRHAGIAVWFDASELRSGDVWDRKIRREVQECVLFVPLISVNTASRHEGYFRLEWDLADQRTHMIARSKAFILPVCLDGVSAADADVPESFLRAQWTSLPEGITTPLFVERVKQLVSPGEPVAGAPEQRSAGSLVAARSRSSRLALLLVAVLALLGFGYFTLDKLVPSKQRAASLRGESAPVAIPEQSIAVLPFVNMSSDKEQEYFSDGLTEEMIDLLSQMPDLRVPARTSSFYFKGKNEAIANIAQQLKVAHVLEGSVRKAGTHLRITAQLIRADNGYHLWSQTYERDDTDVFAVQDDIARAVVSVLKIKLAARVPVPGSRGTTNTEAYDQFLLGRQLARRGNLEGFSHAVESYRKAAELDPNYAAAYAELAIAEAYVADLTGDRSGLERAGDDADKAVALAPADASVYAARGYLRSIWLWDWSGAEADCEKALALEPRDSVVQRRYARLLATLGRLPQAIAALEQARELDPLSINVWAYLGRLYTESGDFKAADAALVRAIEIEPKSGFVRNDLGMLRLLQGNAREALEAFRQADLKGFQLTGIAMAEYALGHAEESQHALDELMAKHAEDSAYQIAEVFAWRGEHDKAFEWLERAYRQRDGGLSQIKADPALVSLHPDRRFTALLGKMKLPE
jgi:TolB-like protein/Flp pilus assembly protein TadD